MIYLNLAQITEYYGQPLAGGGNPRFNATACSVHQTSAYKLEFGYLNGYCIYAIVRKRTSAAISVPERMGILARTAVGEWILIEGSETAKNKPVAFRHSPPKEETKFPSPLFAAHQRQRQQLVVYHPYWQVDLDQVQASA